MPDYRADMQYRGVIHWPTNNYRHINDPYAKIPHDDVLRALSILPVGIRKKALADIKRGMREGRMKTMGDIWGYCHVIRITESRRGATLPTK